ncbi:MAG: NADH-quinone oxidoreductase subunit E [Streptosporangiales bacterium]|nr:NADH-quinone oxidoreductase subunit E [Streptosporangiales bacterium]
MDLRFRDAVPTAEERDAVDALLGPPADGWRGGERDAAGLQHARGGHEARDRRDLLLPALHAVQDRLGWISEGALDYICRRLSVPPAEAYGVATFYALLSLRPAPPRAVHVCTDLACRAAGSGDLVAETTRRLGPAGAPVNGATWHESPCLGLCERAPAMFITEAGDSPSAVSAGPVNADEVVRAVRTGAGALEPEAPPAVSVPQAGSEDLVLLRNVGMVDPADLDAYRARGGYTALRRAFDLGPAGVLREINDSGLVGRGGAAFPTGRKWSATAAQPDHPHYLVCNADESEPGTFKDRVLMEGDPYALIESMTIAGYATGCHLGYLYIRGEYPRAEAALLNAMATARERGLLGDNVLGRGYAFDIELRRGAGAYICGEETAIFNSIEGERGEPRSKPPFPVERGLFGKPTVVNNVETLVNVLPIILRGGPAYAAIGTGTSTGTKLFCVSGSVAEPGVYEVPFGATLRELLELAGGVRENLRAVLLGGAAGAFVRPDELDVPLTFEDTRAAGTTLGSGVVLAIDDSTDLPGVLLRIAAFFRDESCGQCVPCRVGTVRQEEALVRLSAANRGAGANGHAAADIALLREVGQAMKDASICGLGQTAWNAVESAIDKLGTFQEGAS